MGAPDAYVRPPAQGRAGGRSLEDVTRERHGWRQDLRIALDVSGIQGLQRSSSGGSDRIEDSQERMAIPLFVAKNEIGIVEVVARIHAHTWRQAPAHGNLTTGIEQGDLDALDFRGMALYQAQADLHRGIQVVRAPVAGKLGVEHLAEPVEDHRAGD